MSKVFEPTGARGSTLHKTRRLGRGLDTADLKRPLRDEARDGKQ